MTSTSSLTPDVARLFQGGERSAAGSDRPFLLRAGSIWLVEAGYVDVFAVPLQNGAPAGPRRHLTRAVKGQALFGIGDDAGSGWGLLAVGGHETRLLAVREESLRDEATDPAGLGHLVESWVQALYRPMTRDKLPAITIELKPGQEHEVAEATRVRPGGNVAWVRHSQGCSRLMGHEELELNGDDGFVPVSRRAWLEVREPGRLVAVETGRLPRPDDLWAGLARFHRLLLRFVEATERASQAEVEGRMRRQEAFRGAILRDACERLAATMVAGGDEPAAVPLSREVAVEDLEDPLFAACSMIGRALDVPIRSYPRSPGNPVPRDPLAAILRASRVRSRRVALRGTWWREDNGPLLAYRAEDKRPVVLLRRPGLREYVRHDPIDRSEEPIDARTAEQLEPFAFSLYRHLPDTRLGVRDVIRFGLHGCRRDIWLLLGVSLCSSVLGMVPSWTTGMLFNTVIPGAQRSQVLQLALVLLACAVATALFNLAQGIALLRIEGRAGGSLQSAIWDRLLALPLSFYRPYTSGDLAVRAMSVDAIRQVVSGATAQAMMGSILALGNFCLMYWYSWKMALWATVIIAVIIAVTITGSLFQLRPQRRATALQSRSSGIVLQLLSGISKIRVAGAEIPAFALWVHPFSDQRRLQYQARRISTWVAAFNAAMPVASYAIIFYIALPLIADEHTLGVGDFLAFLTAFSASTTSLIGTCLALLATANVIPLYEQARPILESTPEVDAAKADPGTLTGDIEVQQAMFRYHRDGPLVLRDVAVHIRSGEFVAFVGPSGSGKSTLLRLLLGFETLESGGIYYDGQEIGGVDVQAIRRQMGVVLQSGRPMSGDIFGNIVGSSAASLDEAWEAARMAGLDADIEAMPMGMHTVVSEGAGTLSGGQRQRLMIARAIVNRPRIVLFDEATSALDNRSQELVSASLERLQATRIVVAHRLSTIKNADQIYFMERGQIIEAGRYQELMAQEGRFAELARRQIV
jgi:NHLM bacteriocin system ABC transporter ATP-binding protein